MAGPRTLSWLWSKVCQNGGGGAQALLDELDRDKGGDVDEEEFCRFFDYVVFAWSRYMCEGNVG